MLDSAAPLADLRHFRQMASGLDVAPVLAQLDARPDLWDANTVRKTTPGTPHAAMSDIWVRFRPLAELREPADFAAPHFAEFYPAWHALPALHPIVFDLLAQARAVYLGDILITRIPPPISRITTIGAERRAGGGGQQPAGGPVQTAEAAPGQAAPVAPAYASSTAAPVPVPPAFDAGQSMPVNALPNLGRTSNAGGSTVRLAPPGAPEQGTTASLPMAPVAGPATAQQGGSMRPLVTGDSFTRVFVGRIWWAATACAVLVPIGC